MAEWTKGQTLTASPDRKNAFIVAVSAYLLWGLLTLFWPLLEPANALEILAHRVIWSFVTAVVILLIMRSGWGWLRAALNWRTLGIMFAAALLIGTNWGLYIWAVNNGHVIDASLGYYIGPLLSVLLGVVLLRERISSLGWIAIALTVIGVLVAMGGRGTNIPLSLGLASTFSLYGLVKKFSKLSPLQGMCLESALLTPVGLIYLAVSAGAGQRPMFGSSLIESLLLILTGVVTLLPLLMFARAAPALPLGVLGMLQYLLPAAQFLLGLTVFSQTIDSRSWLGFGLAWLGSAAYLLLVMRPRRAIVA